jgi:hypothetical protein
LSLDSNFWKTSFTSSPKPSTEFKGEKKIYHIFHFHQLLVFTNLFT